MPLAFWISLFAAAPITALLLASNAVPGFGAMPGDLLWQSETMTVLIPFVSSSVVALAIYGLIRLTTDISRKLAR